MKNLFSFFKRKSKNVAEADRGSLAGYRAFENGKSHFSARNDQAAVDCFDKAIECGFANSELFGLRGSCLQSLDWHLDAIDDFTRAIALDTDDCNNYFQRAMSKSATGDQAGLEADIEHAIRLSTMDNELNQNYNRGAIEMGHSNTAAMYRRQATLLAQKPAFILERNMERTKRRGRRPSGTSEAQQNL
jgi:Flp pilus assembly protein TadD